MLCPNKYLAAVRLCPNKYFAAVRLCPNKYLAGNAAISKLKASYRQDRFHVEDLDR